MMDLPKTVRIGALDYEIEQWAPRAAQSAQRYGEHSSVEQVIRVDMSQHPQRVREVLLHEILHGIYRMIHFEEVENPSEEFLVANTAAALTQVMADNPELRAWLADAWSGR